MSVPPDDVQDLFDTGEEDEPEEPTEAGDDDSPLDERQSNDDESTGAADGTPVSPSTAPRDAEEPTDSAMDWSTESTEETGDAEDRPTASTSTPEDDSPADVDRPSASGGDAGEQAAGGFDSTAHETEGTDVAGRRSSTHTEAPGGDDGSERPSASPASTLDRESTPSPAGADEPSTGPGQPDEASSDREPAGRSAATDSDDTSPTSTSGSNRLPTGIDALDRAMGGGVPPGRLVLLVADPGVQSELIVDSVLAQRDTLFVSTDRPDWEVTKDIEPGLGTGEVDVRDHTPDSLLSGVDSLLDELGTTSNLVLDSVNELELVPRSRYRIFLSDVKRRLFDTGSIGLLTGVTVDHESARDLTLRRADIVWRLETRTVDDRIENRLSVPKFRGGAAVAETVKLELTDEVKADSSWDDH